MAAAEAQSVEKAVRPKEQVPILQSNCVSEQVEEGILECKLDFMLYIHHKGRLTGPIWQVRSVKGRTMRFMEELLRGLAHRLRHRNVFRVPCHRKNSNSPLLFRKGDDRRKNPV